MQKYTPLNTLRLLVVLSVVFTALNGRATSSEIKECAFEKSSKWSVYEGAKGKAGSGKHVVLLAGDGEYHSEEAMPMLGKLLAKHHGFHCVVLCSQTDGFIDSANKNNLPGLENLAKADLLMVFTRNRELPDRDMKLINDYLLSGRPVIGMRTGNHAFLYTKESIYEHYSSRYPKHIPKKRGQKNNAQKKDVKEEWTGGFGKFVLGEAFVGHHGGHNQSTRGVIVEAAKDHAILRGIKANDIWAMSGVYRVNLPMADGIKPLVLGQVLEGLNPTDAPVEDGKNDPMMPVAWVKKYKLPEGKEGKAFNTTLGYSKDLLNEGTRRLIVNSVYWATDLEVPQNGSDVDIVGEYTPSFRGNKKKIKTKDKPDEVSLKKMQVWPIANKIEKNKKNKKSKGKKKNKGKEEREKAKAKEAAAKKKKDETGSAINHRGIIKKWDEESYKKGEKTYNTMCFACHGTDGVNVSNPTALAFGKGKFKNGSDPYSIFKTLTNGFNTMPAQEWMTADQRYDVIHYIREKYVKENNPSQYYEVTEKYLATLPEYVKRRGEDEFKIVEREYGPVVASQYEDKFGSTLTFDLSNNTYVNYDLHRMQMVVAWKGRLDLDTTPHHRLKGNGYPTISGEKITGLQNWKWQLAGTFDYDESKIQERGPVPEDWMRYYGHYTHGQQAILKYSIAGRHVLEMPGADQFDTLNVLHNTFYVAAGDNELKLCVGQFDEDIDLKNVQTDRVTIKGKERFLATRLLGEIEGLTFEVDSSKRVVLTIPASKKVRSLRVVRSSGILKDQIETLAKYNETLNTVQLPDLPQMTKGGPRMWTEEIKVKGILGKSGKAYEKDSIPLPDNNPWNSWMRTSAVAFFPDGRAVVTTYGGDVWIVSGINDDLSEVTWSRFASGLFEPFGVLVVDGKIYATTHDGIKRLHDLNDDGQADYYETFYTDQDVSCWFHSFNFDLQIDSKGNFYFAKQGLITDYRYPGSIIRVPPEGGRGEIVALGLRTPNGMGKLPGDRFLVSDNQGNHIPASKITIVQEKGYMGVPAGEKRDKGHLETHTPETFDQPLIWMEQDLDSSSGGQLYVDDKRFGPLSGHLLHSSFGKGKMYYLMLQEVEGQTQAAIIRLDDYQFDSGIMRMATNPQDGWVYATGMSGWQGRQGAKHGCLERLRYTGKPIHVIEDVKLEAKGIRVTFNFALDAKHAAKADAIKIEQWNYLWSSSYGSLHYSVKDKEKSGDKKGKDVHDTIVPTSVTVSNDGRELFLSIPDIQPANQVKIQFNLKAKDGSTFDELMYMTINKVPKK